MIRNAFLKRSFVLLLFLAVTAVSCCKHNNGYEGYKGKSITFSTSRTVDTKATFSYPDGICKIYWENGDVIRIYSPDAIASGGSQNWADYGISVQGGLAIFPKIKGNELQWGGDGQHHFYAVFPVGDLNGNTVTANIPSTQTTQEARSLVDESYEFFPMLSQYGYMAAAAEVIPNADPVNLVFKPMFTTICFCVSSNGDDDVVVSGFRLESAGGGALAGGFTAALSAQADPAITINPASTSSSIDVTLDPDGPFNLQKDARLIVSVIVLPQDLTNLTAYFTVNGQDVALPLAGSDGNPIVIHPGQYVNIMALGLLTPGDPGPGPGPDPEPEDVPVDVIITIDGLVVSEYELD